MKKTQYTVIGEGSSFNAMTAIRFLLSPGKIFVHCNQGISRSATVVLAFLMMKRGMNFMNAVRAVRAKREVMPNDGFLRQLAILNFELYEAHKTYQTLRYTYSTSLWPGQVVTGYFKLFLVLIDVYFYIRCVFFKIFHRPISGLLQSAFTSSKLPFFYTEVLHIQYDFIFCFSEFDFNLFLIFVPN